MLILSVGILASLASIPEAWLALIGAMFGGVGLKVLERWFKSKDDEPVIQKQFRDELRQDREDTRDELRRVEGENDQLKEKYYKLQEDFYTLLASTKTQNHKVEEVAKVVDQQHGSHLKEEFRHLPDPPEMLP